jgi:hypothetical protein
VESRDNDADVVINNVVLGSETACIDAVMTDNTDVIRDNVCVANGGDGIRIEGRTSPDGPQVHKNIVRGYGDDGIVGDDSHYRVLDNVIIDPLSGSHDAIDVGGDAVTDDNVCEDDPVCECDLNAIEAPVECLEFLFG